MIKVYFIKSEGKEKQMSKKIVILGAGYAGVHAAKKLAKKYKKNNDVEITLT